MWRELPNLLTASRGLAGPVVLWLLAVGHLRAAFALFVVAALTDLVDGRFAAMSGANRELGRVLDPVADKILGTCTWIGLGASGLAAPWMAALFVLRDVLVAVAWLVLATGRGVTLSSSRMGQLSTSFEGTAMGLLLFHGPFLGVHWPSVGTWVGLAAIVTASASAAGYLADRRVRTA